MIDLDLFPIKKKWLMPCDKCGQFTSGGSGGSVYTDWETGYIDGAICRKCKPRKENDEN